jgi:hypothetical protein
MSTPFTLVRPAAPYRRLTPTIWQCAGRAIWRALHEFGRRRATRQLRAMAERVESHDPALARQLRIASHFDTMT